MTGEKDALKFKKELRIIQEMNLEFKISEQIQASSVRSTNGEQYRTHGNSDCRRRMSSKILRKFSKIKWKGAACFHWFFPSSHLRSPLLRRSATLSQCKQNFQRWFWEDKFSSLAHLTAGPSSWSSSKKLLLLLLLLPIIFWTIKNGIHNEIKLQRSSMMILMQFLILVH